MLLNYLDGYPETGDEGDIMRVSEFGRWFRFLSVVSLMLCGFSINLWAGSCPGTSPCITTLPASQAVPSGGGSTSSVTFTAVGNDGNYASVDYTWNYFDVTAGPSGAWVPLTPGPGVGVLTGATISLNNGNINPQGGLADGMSSSVTIANVPTSANGVLVEFIVSDISAASANSYLAPYADVAVLTVGPTWSGDGTLSSGLETFERLVLLPNNGPLIAIGGNNPESNPNANKINVDVHPGLTAPPSGPDTWSAAAQSLPNPVVRPGATLLPTGAVLITGGLLNTMNDTNAAYLYTYGVSLVPTANLATARDAHTSTLLPNGLVLITGGNSTGTILNSTELYDPASSAWCGPANANCTTVPAPMNVARYDHVATVLADGRVLVTGGFNALGPISSAEIYDPIANTWTLTSPMPVARAYHTSTLLPGGNVLIAGGLNSLGVPLAETEEFNPNLGTFSVVGNMITARDQGTATLVIDGPVATPTYKVLIAGGFTSSGATALSEYFNPTTGAFSSAVPPFSGTFPLIAARDADAAVLVPSGDVVAVGGTTTGGTSLASAEKFWDSNELPAPIPSANIHLANNAVAGQYLAATCGMWNGSTYVAQPGVQYAWTVVDGVTLLPVGGTALYPNYVQGPNGIYTGDTSTIEFDIPPSEVGRTLQLSCLATSGLGIPAMTSVVSPNIAPGIVGGVIPITLMTNNVDGPAPNVTILQGTPITFYAASIGAPTLYAYQWQYFNPAQGWKNWGTMESQSIASASTSSDGMQVQVLVTNLAGTAPSFNHQTLYVVATPTNVVATATPPTIISAANGTYGANGPSVLNVTNTPILPQIGCGVGGGCSTTNTITYQWCTGNSQSLACTPAGPAGPTISVNPAAGGVYSYYAVVTNTLNGVQNAVASNVVTVTVDSLPIVTVQNTITGVDPVALNSNLTPTMLQGDTITFSANITGNGWPAIYTYQWQYFDPLGGWKNWGMGATQAMANAQARSDSMQVRVAVSNLVGTTYSNIVTLFVVTKPTNVAIALTNGVPPGSGNPIAQRDDAVFTATDKAQPGNTTDYTWYEVGDNPIAGGPDLPLNGLLSLEICDELFFFPDPIIASTMVIHNACLGDNGTYYAVASNYNTNVSFTIPLITSPNATSNSIPLVVNVGNWTVVSHTDLLDNPRFEAYSLLIPTSAGPNDFFIGGGLEALGLPPLVDDDIYAPVTHTTGTWTPSGGHTASYHLNGTATLFNDGAPYILIAGGSDGTGDGQMGLDLYNTVTGTYSTSNVALSVPVTQQVAALITAPAAGGTSEVLLAGGQNGDYNNFYNSAWLYTPGVVAGTGDHIAGSNGVLSQARAGAVSVALPGGRVLITGGQGPGGPVNNVDIYDSWPVDYPPTGLYPTALYKTAAGNLGVGKAGTSGDFFAQADCSVVAVPTSCMGTARIFHTATLLEDGRVLIVGGEDGGGNVLSSIEIWDPAANSGAGGFYPLGTRTPGGAVVPIPTPATLLTARMEHEAVLLDNGKVLIFGGMNSTGTLSSAEVVDPNWVYSAAFPSASIPASSLNYARTLASSSILQNGTVLAVGGFNGAALPVAGATEVFNAFEGYTAPTPSSDGTMTTTPYVAGATSAQVTFTPAAGVEITNYTWNENSAVGANVSGQGTSVYNFVTNLQGHFTVTVQVTDEWGITEACSVAMTVNPVGWTWGAPSCAY